MRRLTSNLQFAIIIGLCVFIVMAFISLVFQVDYAQESEFLNYRLAQNFNDGTGLVYNAQEQVLVTLSPLYPILLSIAPDPSNTFATWLSIFSYGITGFGLTLFLRKHAYLYRDIIFIVVIIICSWSAWTNFHTPYPLVFMLSIIALNISQQYPLYSGLIMSITPLLHPLGIVPMILTGIYTKRGRYWQVVFLPSIAWIIGAIISYTPSGLDGLLTTPHIDQAFIWQIGVWLGLFLLAIFALYRAKFDPTLWLFPLWAGLEITTQWLTQGQLGMLNSLALAVTVGLGLVAPWHEQSHPPVKNFASVIALPIIALIFIAPPQTQDNIAQDIAIGKQLQLPANISIAHTRSDALTNAISGFSGNIYHLDGRYSPQLTAFANYDDQPSSLVFTAPHYVLITPDDPPIDFATPNLAGLQYAIVAETDNYQLWERQTDIAPFQEVETTDIAFSSDVSLVGVALDHQRISPNETLRVRLDWALNRAPEDGITVNLTLIDRLGSNVIASIFPHFPAETWTALNLSTYHAIQLPDNVDYGIHRLLVSLDYQAGILGSNIVGDVLVPIGNQTEITAPSIGALGSVTLHQTELDYQQEILSVGLYWQTDAVLDRDYRVFVHVTPLDDLQALTQDDGLISNGQYPTSWWLEDEIVPDTRQISLENLPAGMYRINVGIYTPETGRLLGGNGDFLTIAHFTLTEAREVIFQTD